MRRLNITAVDSLALVQAAPRLIFVWALLPIIGIGRLRRWQGRARASVTSEAFDPELWQCRVRAMRRIGARLPGCHCLARSIALSAWLNRRGHPNQLKIGVAGTSVTLRSHSWVEKNGEILDDSPENIAEFKKITEI